MKSIISKFFILNSIIKSFFFKAINKLKFKYHGVIAKTIEIKGVVHLTNFGKITIGQNFRGNSGKNYNPIGGDTILRLICLKGAVINIGENVGISNSTLVSTLHVEIEDNVLIGGGCKIWDTNFHSLDPKKRGTPQDKLSRTNRGVFIRKNAFIGGNSIILKGVEIGENSIIAAGSVVTKSVPANQIWGGNPAVYIKSITQ